MYRLFFSAVVLVLASAGNAVGEEELTVGTTGDYPPLTYLNEAAGAYEGRDIDLVEAFAKAKGYKVRFVATTWSGLMDGLADNECQMAVGGISRSPERERVALMSVPVDISGKVALVRCGEQSDYAAIAQIDRPDVRVVSNRGGTNEVFAMENLRYATVIIVSDNWRPFEFLKSRQADVMFTDSIEAVYHEEQGAGLCAVDVSNPYTRFEKVFLFGADQDALRDEFNAWFANR